MLFAALTPPTAATITLGELIQSMLLTSEYPWEQLSLQGLQDVPGIDTGQHVHYHVNFFLDCSLSSGYSVSVNLPTGFFPVAGSSFVSIGAGAPQHVADAAPSEDGPRWSSVPSPCGSSTAAHTTCGSTSTPTSA